MRVNSSFQPGDERLGAFRHVQEAAVGGEPWRTLRPGQQLVAVVGERLGADDVHIPGLKSIGQVNENADLQGAPVDGRTPRSALGDEAAPPLRGKAEVEVVRQIVATRLAMLHHHRQRVQQAAILGRGPDVHQVEQAEQQASGPGMDGPEQRQIVVAVPGGDGLALLGEAVDAALLGQQGPDVASKGGVGLLGFCRGEYASEKADQPLFEFAVRVLEGGEPLLGRRLGAPNAADQHLDQFVAAAGAGLADQAEQQGVPFAPPAHVQELAGFQRGGFRRELAELGVGNPLQQRPGIGQAGQPGEAVAPQGDGFETRRPGRLLEAVEGRGGPVGRHRQQRVERRPVFRRQPCRDPLVHPFVNPAAQTVDQPVEGAERRQVDPRAAQRLDGPVDQVGGVAHGFGRIEHDVRDQDLSGIGIGRDIEIGANRRPVAVKSPLPAVLGQERQRGRQTELPGQMRDDAGVDLLKCRKDPEVEARLQDRHQRQAARLAAGGGLQEGMIRLAQSIPSLQFLARQSLPGARVSGAVHGRHWGVRQGNRVKKSCGNKAC